MAIAADNDVVVQRNAERLRGARDLPRHLDVGGRGRRIARGVIVQEPIAAPIGLKTHDFQENGTELGTRSGDCNR
jgi:hypothetical protein